MESMILDTLNKPGCKYSYEVLNKFFGKNYRGFMKVFLYLDWEKTIGVWFPNDRKKHMPTDAVCIAAWGMNSNLISYKKKTFEYIGEERIIGYSGNKDKFEYRYIKPRGMEAQKDVISRIADE